jgi:hypothetical protein
MLASSRLFFDRDSVYKKNRRARQRAIWLYNAELAQAASSAEVEAGLGRDLNAVVRLQVRLKAVRELEEFIEATEDLAALFTAAQDLAGHLTAAGLGSTACALAVETVCQRNPRYHGRRTRVFPRYNWHWRAKRTPDQAQPAPDQAQPYSDEAGLDPDENDRRWGTVAEVAEDYPRLLAWLSEGQVSSYWNVFGALIMVLRAIPGSRRFIWHFMFHRVYLHAPWRSALRTAILADAREQWNEATNRRTDQLTVGEYDIPGLGAVDEISVVLETGTRQTLRRRVANMSAGCVGVTGLRGAGKTTLISDFCAHRYGTPRFPPPAGERIPGLRIMVQAPLVFDAKEFLVHQYICLCRAVLADVRFNPTKLGQHVFAPFLFLRPPRLGTVIGVLMLIASGVLCWRAAAGGWPWHDWAQWLWYDWGGWAEFAVAVLAGLTAVAWRTRRSLIEVRQVTNLADDAEARLQRLQFLRTSTRSGGGTVAGPLGIGLSVGTSSELAQQAITLPELIDDYRDFVERVVGGLQAAEADQHDEYREQERERQAERRGRAVTAGSSADVRLVIGIDQLDQIGDADAARKFLDELGSVFGTPHCVYLVALSPSVLAAVDEQSVPSKTSSSGLFDEMIWVDALSLDDAARLLDRRVIGLPAGFVVLCYLLSGGLPRELLRIARAVFTTRDHDRGGAAPPLPGRPVTLAEATRHVVDEEISALKKRTLANAARLDRTATPTLLRMLADPDWPACSLADEGHQADGPANGGARANQDRLDSIEKVLGDVSGLWLGKKRLSFCAPETNEVAPYTSGVCDSLIAGLFHLLTIRRLCTSPAADDVAGLAWEGDAVIRRPAGDAQPWLTDSTGALRDLARARIILGTSPYAAASLVHSARHRLERHAAFEPRFKDKVTLGFLNERPARGGAPAEDLPGAPSPAPG